jgi:CrcB protein
MRILKLSPREFCRTASRQSAGDSNRIGINVKWGKRRQLGATRRGSVALAIVGILATAYSLWAVICAGAEAVGWGAVLLGLGVPLVFLVYTELALNSMWRSLIAVAVGGALGCLFRWYLAIFLNRYFPAIPPGTLAANLIGCYVIGVAIAFFTTYPTFAPEWRLFITTGFCGGLTTFSTFSAEVVMLMQSGRSIFALGAVGAHLIGSLLLTFAGIATVAWLKG